MTRGRGRHRDRDLMQVAAAVVGAAGATQMLTKASPQVTASVLAVVIRLGEVDWKRICAELPNEHPGEIADALEGLVMAGRLRRDGIDYFPVLAAEHGRHGHVCPGDCPDASQVLPQVAEAALDVHAALNTYEVAAGVPEQFGSLGQTAFVVGANGRKLIARWQDEGVWIGGCLITDRGVAERLAAFITQEADAS